MWITIDDDRATRAMYDEKVLPPEDDRECDLEDYRLEINDNGTVQVPAEVGEAYVAHYDWIRPYEAGDTA